MNEPTAPKRIDERLAAKRAQLPQVDHNGRRLTDRELGFRERQKWVTNPETGVSEHKWIAGDDDPVPAA